MLQTNDKLIHKNKVYMPCGWYTNPKVWEEHAKKYNYYPSLCGWLAWAKKTCCKDAMISVYDVTRQKIEDLKLPVFELEIKEVKHWKIVFGKPTI